MIPVLAVAVKNIKTVTDVWHKGLGFYKITIKWTEYKNEGIGCEETVVSLRPFCNFRLWV